MTGVWPERSEVVMGGGAENNRANYVLSFMEEGVPGVSIGNSS